jgi:tetratricopeptide (TPR) repeat protein
MKRFTVCLAFVFLCGLCYAQQTVVAVFPFEARSGTSKDDANTVTEVFNIKLQATGALRTVGRNVIDNVIKQEQIYQMSDISTDEKTAQLKKGLNADWVVYGVVTKLGRTFVITATLIDLNTNETMGGAPMQMDSIEEAFEKMDAPITEMIQRLTGGGRAAAPAGSNKEAVAHLEKGKIFNGRKDYDTALAEFTEAIRIDPNYAEAYYWRGLVHENKGDYDREIADATQALRINPDYAGAYRLRGYAYLQKGDYDRAIADYTQAIRIDPNDADAYNNRGVSYYNKRDYDRAIADYTEALRINPNAANAKKNLEIARKRGK